MDTVHSFDASGAHFDRPGQITVCRTIKCGRIVFGPHELCVRCREEIAAVRAMARRRFVIWGAAGMRRAADR